MLRQIAFVTALLCAALSCAAQEPNSNSLIPKGFRAIATPDDSAIILVSDPTNGAGKGLTWLGIGGAIACEADNSIIVWSASYAPPLPLPPAPMAAPVTPPPAPADGQRFLWPEGVQNVVPFDLDNSIILMSD